MLLALVVGKGEAGEMHGRGRIAVCRTGFVMVICGTHHQKKIGSLCLKIIKNFKMASAAYETFWVGAWVAIAYGDLQAGWSRPEAKLCQSFPEWPWLLVCFDPFSHLWNKDSNTYFIEFSHSINKELYAKCLGQSLAHGEYSIHDSSLLFECIYGCNFHPPVPQ